MLRKILLAPFALLYGLGVQFWKLTYRVGLRKSIRYSIPTIAVGNLSTGGTGKSPHVEFIVRFLSEYMPVATLSRGYNRKTRGFILATPSSDAAQIGDEPLQFKRKFPAAAVAVAEDRAFAVPRIMAQRPDVKTIILDDAFQHLALQADWYILLTTFQQPFFKDYLLPSGNLREERAAYKRAQVIIVTKCPADLSEATRQSYLAQIKPLPHQSVYFSYYQYAAPYLWNDATRQIPFEALAEYSVLVVAALANTDYLEEFVSAHSKEARLLAYSDHHYFTKGDVGDMRAQFERMPNTKKIILTTEKDATRLELHREALAEWGDCLYVLPIEVDFCFGEKAAFQKAIQQFLLDYKI